MWIYRFCIQTFIFIAYKFILSGKNTYSKEERLKSSIRINQVYTQGESGFCHPFKYYFIHQPSSPEVSGILKTCFSIPKRKFKKAVDRNRIKRLCKESFRLNKSIYYQNCQNIDCDVYLIFIGKDIPDYVSMEKGMKNFLEKLSKHLSPFDGKE